MNKLGQRWVVMIGIMVIAVGCAGLPFAPTATPDVNLDATWVARTWIEAFFSSQGTVLARYTCRASHAEISEASLTYQLFSSLGSLLQGVTLGSEVVDSSVKVDLSQVQFRIVEQSSGRAVVETSGDLILSIGGAFQQENAGLVLDLEFEDGYWKVCGSFDDFTADAFNRSMGGADQPQPMGSVAQAIENARTFTGTRNDDWQPFSYVFSDGVERVLVPVGCFMMGSNDGDDDEQPVHEQCVTEPFWLDKYEVTNALYGSVSGCSYSSQADQPRNCVDWYDAQAFCEAQGGTLPSEMQWEYAARGVESWEYPWGNDYDAERVIGEDDPTYGDTQTAPVGSRPDGASWVGAMDMSGNVWEWTSTAHRNYPYTQEDEQPNNQDISRVLRGGSFFNPAYVLRSADRFSWYPSSFSIEFGFRCALSLNNSGL